MSNSGFLDSGIGPSAFGGSGELPAPVPVAGAELLTNGGFESWASATDANNWTEGVAGGNTVNEETSVVAAGSRACRFDIAGVSPTCSVVHQGASVVGGYYMIKGQYRNNGSNSGYFVFGGNLQQFPLWTTAWKSALYTQRAVSTGELALATNSAIASSSLYYDDFSIVPLTLSSLFSTRPYASANCDLSAAVTRTAGTQAGFVARLDSASSPANFLIAYLDGASNVKVDKCVAGTYTNVISGAVTYGSTKILRLVCSGNSVSAYYDGTQVGSTVTVSDAGIASNTRHGLFSTYASNSFAGYVAA